MRNDTSEHGTIVMPPVAERATTRPATSSIATPHIGARLGRYRLCLELATGGMSTVYLARVEDGVGRHRFVALKCLKPRLAGELAYAEMFLDEARVASMIHHPNVCDVIDFRVQGGISYMVMELLEGQTLAAVLSATARLGEAPAPARIAAVVARIVADAAEGLHAAHELTDRRGEPLHVVHRDISPENVFITYDGNVKIMDFGVAVTSQQRHQTEPGTFKGKYSYVAPEVLRGGKPDRRVDVWGLGMIAWELLAGRRLFEVENEIDVLRAVMDMDIPKPSSIRPGIPAALDDVVLRALHRDPARRFATARELGRHMTCLLAEERLAVGLAELSDFVGQLFPNGAVCARQLRDTVDRMDVTPAADDGVDHPTVASPLSLPTVARAATAPVRDGGGDPAPITHATGVLRRPWMRAVLPPLLGVGIVSADLTWRSGDRGESTAAAAPAAMIAPRPLAAPGRPASATPQLQVELEPMQMPSGEVVFRLHPTLRDDAPAGPPR